MGVDARFAPHPLLTPIISKSGLEVAFQEK